MVMIQYNTKLFIQVEVFVNIHQVVDLSYHNLYYSMSKYTYLVSSILYTPEHACISYSRIIL